MTIISITLSRLATFVTFHFFYDLMGHHDIEVSHERSIIYSLFIWKTQNLIEALDYVQA